jgi:hypothetical protein
MVKSWTTRFPASEFLPSTVAVKLNLAEIEGLAAGGAYAGTYTMCDSSVALVLSWLALLFHWNWDGAGFELTPEEKDTIDGMIAQCLTELLIPTEVGGDGMITGVVYTVLLNALLPGMHYLNGAVLDGEDYPLLYAAIADTFKSGGDIHLPNYRGRAVIATGTGVGMSPRLLDESGGAEEHELLRVEMPTHDHVYDRVTEKVGGELRMGSGFDYYDNIGAIASGTGGGEAHENMQPWATARMAIYTDDRP